MVNFPGHPVNRHEDRNRPSSDSPILVQLFFSLIHIQFQLLHITRFDRQVLVLVMLALADSPRPELPWDLKLQQSQAGHFVRSRPEE